MQEAQEMQIRSLSREDSLEKEMTLYPNSIAWRISWTESLVGYSQGSRKESYKTERMRTRNHIASDYMVYCEPFQARM